MSFSTTWSLVGLLQWVAAILACAWALRSHTSRARVVLLSVGAAVLAGLCLIVPLVQMAVGLGEGFDNVPYRLGNLLLGSAILGAVVGAGGLVWQTVEKRRAHRA